MFQARKRYISLMFYNSTIRIIQNQYVMFNVIENKIKAFVSHDHLWTECLKRGEGRVQLTFYYWNVGSLYCSFACCRNVRCMVIIGKLNWNPDMSLGWNFLYFIIDSNRIAIVEHWHACKHYWVGTYDMKCMIHFFFFLQISFSAYVFLYTKECSSKSLYESS